MIKAPRKITPEEKLLHIIEKPEDMGKMNIRKRGGIFKLNFKKISLHGVNKALISLSAVVTLALVFFFIKDENAMRARFAAIKEGVKKEVSSTSGDEKKPETAAAYIMDTLKNNPFHVLPQVTDAKAKQEEMASNLKLVGIIWSDKPQAIIEDEKTSKNYLVYEGDTIENFKVDEIARNEVKLVSKDGEKILK